MTAVLKPNTFLKLHVAGKVSHILVTGCQVLLLMISGAVWCSISSAVITQPNEADEDTADVTNAADGEGSATYAEPAISDSDRGHWAFRPLSDVLVPGNLNEARNTPPEGIPSRDQETSSWAKNEIDVFIAHRLRQSDLPMQPPADPHVLLRRATLQLTGLLPEPEELKDFQNDLSPDAFADCVDRLLQSDAYGEHQAQSWLELVRFAETDGFEHDKVREHAWQYRDWVITAINEDLPYDQFVQMQIAGDLLQPENPSAHIATHFCVCGPDMPDINLQDERRHMLLNDMTSATGEVFLALQLGCAQCHDHKYDAVSQADFYRMRAVFEPSLILKKNASVDVLTKPANSEQVSYMMLRGDFRRRGQAVHPGVLRVLTLDGGKLNALEQANAPSESPATISPPAMDAVHTSATTRLRFARWLTGEASPLTARVLVNRVWQQHFGTGLSDTPGDFGVMGQEPTHPELLDWLAGWLIRNQWHVKDLRRLILMSATWQQRSFLPSNADENQKEQWNRSLKFDRNARLLSRFPRQRVSGEILRDVMLQSAGALNRKMGGPGIRPPLPEELRATLLTGQWTETEDQTEHTRRSIYVFVRRNLRYPIFEVFDRPAAIQSCSVRNTSTTAPQALHLMNADFSWMVANRAARRIAEQHSDPEDQIQAAFLVMLSRLPTDEELTTAITFLKTSQESEQPLSNDAQNDRRAGLAFFCLCLLNSNEFVYVD